MQKVFNKSFIVGTSQTDGRETQMQHVDKHRKSQCSRQQKPTDHRQGRLEERPLASPLWLYVPQREINMEQIALSGRVIDNIDVVIAAFSAPGFIFVFILGLVLDIVVHAVGWM